MNMFVKIFNSNVRGCVFAAATIAAAPPYCCCWSFRITEHKTNIIMCQMRCKHVHIWMCMRSVIVVKMWRRRLGQRQPRMSGHCESYMYEYILVYICEGLVFLSLFPHAFFAFVFGFGCTYNARPMTVWVSKSSFCRKTVIRMGALLSHSRIQMRILYPF